MLWLTMEPGPEVAVRLRLFPREEAYFDLFERAGANAAEAARVLVEMMESFGEAKARAERLTELEHEGDDLVREVVRRLNSSFVTPFDREDIYTLSNQLDDITDAIEAIADMLILHRVAEPIPAVKAQAKLLHQATAVIADSMGHLRTPDAEALRASWEKIQELEDEGDRLYRRTRAELYEVLHYLDYEAKLDELFGAREGTRDAR